MIQISDHVLHAFKVSPTSDFISARRLNEAVDSWRQNIQVLDEVNEDSDGEEEDEEYGGFEEENEENDE